MNGRYKSAPLLVLARAQLACIHVYLYIHMSAYVDMWMRVYVTQTESARLVLRCASSESGHRLLWFSFASAFSSRATWDRERDSVLISFLTIPPRLALVFISPLWLSSRPFVLPNAPPLPLSKSWSTHSQTFRLVVFVPCFFVTPRRCKRAWCWAKSVDEILAFYRVYGILTIYFV